jgi:hypothetical protein
MTDRFKEIEKRLTLLEAENVLLSKRIEEVKMPKRVEEYKPSPWLREEVDKDKVKMPMAMIGALYALQKDDQEVEYGGAVDFEIVKKQPQVERVLAYTGIVKAVPGYIWERVFSNPDVELTFHTHPRQDIAIPSEGDVIFFLTTAAQAMLIIAGQEAILLTKGDNTPPPEFVRENITETTTMVSVAIPRTRYDPRTARKEQQEGIRDLKRELDIDCVVIPMGQPIEITMDVIKGVL